MDLYDFNTLINIITTSAKRPSAMHSSICIFNLKIIECMITNSHLPDQSQFSNRFADGHLHCKRIINKPANG
jgi:hypothetical protein